MKNNTRKGTFDDLYLSHFAVLDFGGAAPIHVPAAAAGLTYSYFLGPRSLKERSARPHNMAYLVIGMIFMWFGTFGYNVGSGKIRRHSLKYINT